MIGIIHGIILDSQVSIVLPILPVPMLYCWEGLAIVHSPSPEYINSSKQLSSEGKRKKKKKKSNP